MISWIIGMSQTDALILIFLVIVALLIGVAWIGLHLAYVEVREKWTCRLRQVPSPSIIASSDGGTI